MNRHNLLSLDASQALEDPGDNELRTAESRGRDPHQHGEVLPLLPSSSPACCSAGCLPVPSSAASASCLPKSVTLKDAAAASKIPSQGMKHGSCWTEADDNPRRHKATITETDRVLAKELNDLTVEERNIGNDEIHGMPHLIDETEEHNRRLLHQMDEHVSAIKSKPAYERALFMSPKYVNDQAFRMSFLRAENYDPVYAARRMVMYYSTKLDLFGQDRLVKHIGVQDLTDSDRHHIHGGSLQCLPSVTDRAGRIIFFSYGQYHRQNSLRSSMRGSWFIMESAFRNNAEAQRKGMVMILYLTGVTSITITLQELFYTKCSLLGQSLPIRLPAVHICYNLPQAKPFINLLMMKLPKEARLRHRVHLGSQVESLYTLQGYGIPSDVLPIQDDGNPDNRLLLKYLAQTEQDEREQCAGACDQQKQTAAIPFPKYNDILLGRGRPYQTFSGNQKLLQVIDTNADAYRSCAHGDKRTFCQSIVTSLKNKHNARFLKRDAKGDWEEVLDDIATDKVGYSFRSKFSIQKRRERKAK